MRLARLVAAGLVLGAVVGFAAAFTRPRGRRPATMAPDVPGRPPFPAPLPTSAALAGTGGPR